MMDSLSTQHSVHDTFLSTLSMLRHIIINTLMTKIDGTTTDVEMLHRVQEYCVDIFDELNLSKYQAVRRFISREKCSTRTILTYLISNIGSSELLPNIKERYKNKLSEKEFDMLNNLIDSVSEHLSKISKEFLMSTKENLKIKE